MISENVNALCHKYSLQLTLACNAVSGYFMQLKISQKFKFTLNNLPNCFILLGKKCNVVFVTTEQLIVDSQKCKEICEEIHVMSNM